MKSYVAYLHGLYSAIFSQIAEEFPDRRIDCERDFKRLLSLVDSRGISFYMIDLPAFGKVFDMALSQGQLTRSNMPASRPYKNGVVIPRLFKGLLLSVFDDFGLLRSEPCKHSIRFLRQLYYAAKKVKIECSNERTWKQVHEFFTTDKEVRTPTLSWADDELRINDPLNVHFGDTDRLNPVPLLSGLWPDSDEESLSTIPWALADAVQRTADAIAAEIGGFDPLEWRAKHGDRKSVV